MFACCKKAPEEGENVEPPKNKDGLLIPTTRKFRYMNIFYKLLLLGESGTLIALFTVYWLLWFGEVGLAGVLMPIAVYVAFRVILGWFAVCSNRILILNTYLIVLFVTFGIHFASVATWGFQFLTVGAVPVELVEILIIRSMIHQIKDANSDTMNIHQNWIA